MVINVTRIIESSKTEPQNRTSSFHSRLVNNNAMYCRKVSLSAITMIGKIKVGLLGNKYGPRSNPMGSAQGRLLEIHGRGPSRAQPEKSKEAHGGQEPWAGRRAW
ncbi:unnamed protein product [Linum trigynum]|uniref:Uncharacterized protein n=1 Tax=Linum trigynum TaxID=586398 RepID=A0AAV2G1Q0_9ROSI